MSGKGRTSTAVAVDVNTDVRQCAAIRTMLDFNICFVCIVVPCEPWGRQGRLDIGQGPLRLGLPGILNP